MLPTHAGTRPRELSLKLDQQRSSLRIGESTEVECYSSDQAYTDVVWERADGEPLPPHIQQIGNRLMVTHVTAADAGNYHCKCKTDDGDLYTTSYELEIEATATDNDGDDNDNAAAAGGGDDGGDDNDDGDNDDGDAADAAPEQDAAPHASKRPRIVHAQVGASVTMHCNADGETNDGSHQHQLHDDDDDDDERRTPTKYRWTRQHGQISQAANMNLHQEHLTLNDVQANDAGTYICNMKAITTTKTTTTTTTHDDDDDDDDDEHDYATILVVTGAIPRFHQEPISYLALPTLADSYIKFNFEITFRPSQPNGLLLFNGQKRGGNGDYIALSLNDHYPEFRFDFDGRPMVVRADRPITLHEWHTIRVNRFRRDGYIQVDDQHPVAFPTLAQISPLDLIEALYVGAVPQWSMLPPNAAARPVGFVGCISRLTLQGTIVELMREAKLREGVAACEPCAHSPCNNGGICVESQTEEAYTCICQPGWTGRRCAVAGTQCTPAICGTGRCENTDTGMECLCPLNRTGDRCQYIEHLKEHSLAFKANSYAAYSTPRPSKLNIRFQVRPNTLHDAVLMYAAESLLPSGDFVAVLLRNDHVELMVNTGARRPVVVRSQRPLPVNQWSEVEVSRRFGEAILRVGDEPETRAKASGQARTLYIKTPMYIGGYDHEHVKLNRAINITHGFDGCISNLFEAQHPINLIADIQDAANVQNCGEINEIDANETFEQFQQPPSNDPCSYDPCENGGTCREHNAVAACDCPLGYTGKHCEEHITIEFNVNFHGNGYLEVNRSQFDPSTEQKYSFAAIIFATTEPNGLLLWWGQPKDKEYKGQDFMALAIVDGIVEFSLRLNGEETVIRNPDKRVNDGKRHLAIIKRNDNTAILELDNVIDSGETRPTGKSTISLNGNVFIGGAPNAGAFTGSRYTKGFTGCIHVVEGNTIGTISVGKTAVGGLNVDTCPSKSDSNEESEPPIV